jgi:hypothetical protein
MAIPRKDSLLVPWSTNWNTRTVAAPADFALTAAQCTAYTALHTPYIAAVAAIASPGAKSKALVAVKDAAKNALLAYARGLYAFVQNSNGVTVANKELLGITIRSMPQPIPAPGVSPALDILTVTRNVVKVRVHDAADARRPKPAGVKAAAIMSYVGPIAPTDPSLYKWEGSTGRSVFDVVFPESLAPGTQVWLCATWVNERQQTGPACTPVGTVIQYGMSAAA